GIASLLSSDFERGWREYGWRKPSALEPSYKPRWDGSSLSGKTILLYPEQGMGDTIQFIRFAPMLQALGARVIFGCPAPLIQLLEHFPGIDVLLPDRAPLPPFDCYVPLLNLPGLLGIDQTNIPATVPYLTVPDDVRASWKHKLASVKGLRVGIAWQGNPKHKGDRQRSVPLKQFAPISCIEGVSLVSLQQQFGVEQLAGAASSFSVFNPGATTDFLDTAGLIANLDLVVTVDTSVAHLAGAMGVRTCVVLPFVPDWRWMLDRDDSPWYPTMWLFRQSRPGDWPAVFERVAAFVLERCRR